MPTQAAAAVQVGGFLQRLDYVRKWAFGVISILKNEEGQFPVKWASYSTCSVISAGRC